jgi:hypothetical protein
LRIALRQGQVELAGGEGALPRLLTDAGYPVLPEELEELSSAVYGVLLGPKGTLMSGQTKVLTVVSTTFD